MTTPSITSQFDSCISSFVKVLEVPIEFLNVPALTESIRSALQENLGSTFMEMLELAPRLETDDSFEEYLSEIVRDVLSDGVRIQAEGNYDEYREFLEEAIKEHIDEREGPHAGYKSFSQYLVDVPIEKRAFTPSQHDTTLAYVWS